jgi:hypothetical protein
MSSAGCTSLLVGVRRAIEPSEKQRRSLTCHSSWASTSTAPASRSRASGLRKTLTTSVRRLISAMERCHQVEAAGVQLPVSDDRWLGLAGLRGPFSAAHILSVVCWAPCRLPRSCALPSAARSHHADDQPPPCPPAPGPLEDYATHFDPLLTSVAQPPRTPRGCW